MDKPALHVVSLPHTQVTKEYISCAYTQKHLKFCKMMKSLGYTVYSYASEENEIDVDETVQIVSKEDQLRWFGDNDFTVKFFNITWGPDDTHWQIMNLRAIAEIQKRYTPGDIICLIAGACQKQIADAFPQAFNVEYGIGYVGVFSNFKVFESYSHMHWIYGRQGSDDGRFYDCVIPNYFEPQDFQISHTKEDYYLFIGRLIQRKGPEIAVEATRRLGAKLVMAGQGVAERGGGYVVAEDGSRYEGKHIEHIGTVGEKERSELMANAKAVFVPTTYLEPFGGVSIEAMFCGTPVIATDFGAFSENVKTGISGFRFRTIGEAVQAARECEKLVPSKIRRYALDNFSTEVAKHQYDDYFEQLRTLNEGGSHPDGYRRDGFYSDWTSSLLRYKN